MPILNVYKDGSVSRTYDYEEIIQTHMIRFIKSFLMSRFENKASIDQWTPTPDDHMVMFFNDLSSNLVLFMFHFKKIDNIFYLFSIASAPSPHRVPGFARRSLINWIEPRKSHYMALGLNIRAPLPEIHRLATLYSGLGFQHPAPSSTMGPYYYSTPQVRLIRIPDTPVDTPKNPQIIKGIMDITATLRTSYKIA
jgi:hypothetical protein